MQELRPDKQTARFLCSSLFENKLNTEQHNNGSDKARICMIVPQDCVSLASCVVDRQAAKDDPSQL